MHGSMSYYSCMSSGQSTRSNDQQQRHGPPPALATTTHALIFSRHTAAAVGLSRLSRQLQLTPLHTQPFKLLCTTIPLLSSLHAGRQLPVLNMLPTA
jgi:hypothetical protein